MSDKTTVPKESAVILLSGGLDSACNLALAVDRGIATCALTMAYGQRAERPELEAAKALAVHYKVPWEMVDVRWLGKLHPNALTRPSIPLPALQRENLDNLEVTTASKDAVWVANRNGLFLNIAAAYAEALGCSRIVAGFNKEEAATFPDNSSQFLDALNYAFFYSTRNHVRVESFTLEWDKKQIMTCAREQKLPLELVWSCYEGGPSPCGQCESCKRFERAMNEP